MKKYLIPLSIAAVLSGCQSIYVPTLTEIPVNPMYEIYLRSAVDSQRGEINTEQSKLYIQNALRGWQQRWKNMDAKPNNPAFTNFLLEVMKMQPLK